MRRYFCITPRLTILGGTIMIKYMKKIFLLLMILTVSFSLVSCNENESSNGKNDIRKD